MLREHPGRHSPMLVPDPADGRVWDDYPVRLRSGSGERRPEWKVYMSQPHPRRGPLVLEPAERQEQELERHVLARTGSQQAAYRAAIILRPADRQTDQQIA